MMNMDEGLEEAGEALFEGGGVGLVLIPPLQAEGVSPIIIEITRMINRRNIVPFCSKVFR